MSWILHIVNAFIAQMFAAKTMLFFDQKSRQETNDVHE